MKFEIKGVREPGESLYFLNKESQLEGLIYLPSKHLIEGYPEHWSWECHTYGQDDWFSGGEESSIDEAYVKMTDALKTELKSRISKYMKAITEEDEGFTL